MATISFNNNSINDILFYKLLDTQDWDIDTSVAKFYVYAKNQH